MKQLLAGAALVLVIGLAGFLYRNALEHPLTVPIGTATSTAPVACTLEAKICPDGTSVGREGSACSFAVCPPPNAASADLGIAFVLPAGYIANDHSVGAEPTLSAVFDKPSRGTVPHSILIRRYPIPAGKTFSDVIVASTVYESSGNSAKSLSEFKPTVINGKTFYAVVLERFEGQVHSAYYLPRATDVLRFEVLEKDVTGWTDPKLVVGNLPQHQALLHLLSSLQSD